MRFLDAGSEETATHKAWFALRVRSNFENSVSQSLRNKEIEEFAPQYSGQHSRRNTDRLTHRPLFPGYVFCNVFRTNRLPVLKIPGVLHFVGFGGEPAPIPTHEITAVRKMLQSPYPITLHPILKTGQGVIIEDGPLRGLEAVVEASEDPCRGMVSITILGRTLSVRLSPNMIRVV